MKRYRVLVLIVLILIIGMLASVWSSPNFRQCVNNGGQYPTAETKKNKAASVAVPSSSGVESIGVCIGGFANENGGGITALATVLLTLVTGVLGYLAYLQFVTSRAQLRAYVFVDGIGIFDGGTWADAPVPALTGCPNSHMVIKNFGQTPAYKVRHWSNVILVTPGNENAQCFIRSEDVSAMNPTTIGPSGTTNMTRKFPRVITPFEIAALSTGGQSIVAFGKITYEDAFGVGHETNYRVGYVGTYPAPPNTILIYSSEGNTAT